MRPYSVVGMPGAIVERIAAQVRVRLRAERGDRAVVLRAHLEIRDVIPAVGRRAVVLRAALHPLHRPSELLGERPDEHVLRIEEDLRAESATDLRRDAAHLRLGNAEDEGGHEEPHDVRSLRRHPDRVLAGRRVVGADCAAWLHGVGISRWFTSRCFTTTSALGDRLVASRPVAAFPVHADVGRRVLVDLGCTVRDRLLCVDDNGQRLPVDLDQRHRVLRRVPILGKTTTATPARVRHLVDLEHARRVDVFSAPA